MKFIDQDKSYKKLAIRFILSITLLMLIFLAKQLVIGHQLSLEVNTSYTINISGRQRMLSQKITKDLILIHNEKDDSLKIKHIKELEASLKLFQYSQKELLALNVDKSFLENNEVVDYLFTEINCVYQNLVISSQNYLNIVKTNNNLEELDDYYAIVVESEQQFLEKMDAIVLAYEEKAKDSVEKIEKTHAYLFVLILAIIIYIVFVIFIPLLKHLRKAYISLESSSRNLMNIVQTMKGSIIVVNSEGEIVFVNEDARASLTGTYSETSVMHIETCLDWIDYDICSLVKGVFRDDNRIEDIETNILNKDGSISSYMMAAFTAIFRGNDVVVLSLFDVTTQKKAKELLENIALRDELTGLYNRHFLESIIYEEFAKSQSYHQPLSAAILDLDDFKLVNDKYGHPVGDVILKEAADTIVKTIRNSDFAIRIGGEEFIVLMPNTNEKGAMITAEKIRAAIENLEFSTVGQVTVSIGVAQRQFDEKYTILYKRLDAALYKAKETGKNKIILSKPDEII